MLKAYIIGVNGNHRNPNLVDDLSPWFEVVETNGYVEMKSNEEFEHMVDTEVFEALLAKYPTSGEVACFLAHLNAWRWLVDSKERALAVFEDDASVENDLSVVVTELERLRGPWQVALERRLGDFLWSHLIPRHRRIWRSIVQPRGAGAYIISAEAATRLVKEFDQNRKFDGVADASSMQSRLVRFYVCLPPPVRVSKGVSSLIGRRNPKLRRFRDFPRRIGVLLSQRNREDSGKLGSYFRLKVIKSLKYLYSLHFLTFWLIRRINEVSKN